jgi:Fe-S-cluster containining protein
MTLPIRTLPLEQRWDCHGCCVCCRGGVIWLNDEDLSRLGKQRWDEHPDYRGVRIVLRKGLWGKRRRLAKRKDGRCVFLMSDGRCHVHAEHGQAAKPLVCQMFPLQLVPLGDFAYLTTRRSCPSAAADRGRKLEAHRRQVRRLAEQSGMIDRPTAPPAITPGLHRPWKDTSRVMDVIRRLMLDPRYPIVRRLAHGLQFCELLGMCRLHKLQGDQLAELLPMLETSAVEEAGGLFRDRKPPGRMGRMLFRQTALEYLSLHPSVVVEASWPARWRLILTTLAFARGKGRLPRIPGDFPETTFEALERPLGHLDQAALGPLSAYFEAAAASGQYAVLGRRGWSIVEGFRALAVSHSIAMWMLRLVWTDRQPDVEDIVAVVGAIDRGQGHARLAGRPYRRRVTHLARLGQLGRLVAWYAR